MSIKRLVAGVVMLLLGGAIAFVAIREAMDQAELARDGIMVTANARNFARVTGGRSGPRNEADYSFFTLDRHLILGKAVLPESAFIDAMRSEKIEVRYLPDNPDRNRAVQDTGSLLDKIAAYSVILVFVLLGLVVIRTAFKPEQRAAAP